ncbi:MAG: hypothetical protein JRG96_10970 [Deltaproteobacteria bacterium]|nr:hypothetical protein [Deltaproteobacteria bacterium]
MSLVWGLLLPSLAWGRVGAPNPIEAGEFYLKASYGRQLFEAPQFRYGLQYIDDSVLHPAYFSLDGETQGYLINLETKAYDWVPEIAVGWGFSDTAFDGLFHGVVRAEVGVRGQKWKTTSNISGPLLPASDGYFLPDPGDELNEFETGLLVSWSAIDGSQNDIIEVSDDVMIHGTGLVTDSSAEFAVYDATIQIEETSGAADFMFFIDNSHKNWQFTRGVGFSYARLHSKMMHRFYMPGLTSVDPTLASTNFDYEYDIITNYFGAKLAFSSGYEFFNMLTLFLNGSFTPYLGFVDLEGWSDAPCLGVCNPGGGDLSRGSVFVKRTKTVFAFDAQAGLGLSLDIWKLRITGEGGGEQFHGYVRPQPTRAGETIDMRKGGGWGWYWSASAMVAF